MTNNPLEQIRELLPELMSVCEMIGYATSGNERASHRALRDEIKSEILAILASTDWVCVPQQFQIGADAWEAAQFVFGGPGTGDDEAFMDCTAWVGEVDNDDGSKTYGLHIACNECIEEGSITLAEFAAATGERRE